MEELITECRKNNKKAQEKLYSLYKDKLFPSCLKYCTSYVEAEDHLHDAFIEIFKKINTYQGKGSFEGWMKRIVINMAIDKYKKHMVYTLTNEKAMKLSDQTSIDKNDLPLSLETLMCLIQQLPNQYRIIFNLYQLDDYTHKEIANMLSISESTSKSNLHRAKLILKEKIIALKSKINERGNHGK